jgi:hypothetical protein
MRPRRRAGFAPNSFAAAEMLEERTLLSATPILTEAQASVVSRLRSAPNVNANTSPTNADENPYGVAFVPQGVATGGKLVAGDILVSNFNNSSNLQGTGSTIVEIAPNGSQTPFFQGPKGMNLGLTTALGVLKNGFVLVGNVPTTNGKFSTIEQGSLLVLNKNGQIVANLQDPVKLDGPWDLALVDDGNTAIVFVSNVLNGTVTRLTLSVPTSGNIKVLSSVTIGSGYGHAPNGPALVVGPTGLAFNPLLDVLYVASTDDNTIYAIPGATILPTSLGKGIVVFHDNAVLRGPLGLVLLPDGNLITANGDAINANANQPSELVEFTPTGQFVGEVSIDPGEGGAFGIAAEIEGNDLVFAAVDDNSNSLLIWDLPL